MNYVTRGLWGHRDHSLQGERQPNTQSGLWVLEEEGKSMCAELAAFAPTWKGQARLSEGCGFPDGAYRSCESSLGREEGAPF